MKTLAKCPAWQGLSEGLLRLALSVVESQSWTAGHPCRKRDPKGLSTEGVAMLPACHSAVKPQNAGPTTWCSTRVRSRALG